MTNSKIQNFVIVVIAVFAIIISSQRFSTISNLLTFNSTNNDNTTPSFKIELSNLSNVNIVGDARVTLNPEFTPSYIGDFEMTIKKPGDGISYTFDIANTGDINAKIKDLNISTPVCTYNNKDVENYVCDNIIYTLSYTGTNREVQKGDKIKAGELVSLTLDITYNGAAFYTPDYPVTISNINTFITFE